MNYSVSRTTSFAAALGLATAMATGAALADERTEYEHQAPPPPVEQEQHFDSAELSDAKIDQFVDALVEVHTIRNDAAAELEGASDLEEAQEIQQRAQQQMIDAVEEIGLSVEEYNQIATLMSVDPELQQRISSKLEDRS